MNKQGTFKVSTMLLYDRQLGFYRGIYYNNALRNYEEKTIASNIKHCYKYTTKQNKVIPNAFNNRVRYKFYIKIKENFDVTYHILPNFDGK